MAKNPKSVTIWLLICCAMIFIMALIGAITRLTLSGLSITDWKPLTGVIPPLNDAAWQQEFDAYKRIPQYQILNRGMSLDEFKGIFFWEWLHRLWGRLIGIVFLLPLICFAARRRISRQTGIKFAVIFVLGAIQGFVGWFMVESGLDIRTSVSPYRLALHLDFALAIYALLLWAAFDGVRAARLSSPTGIKRHGWTALVLLAVTMSWGAFTAGMHAGEVYNTWPLMEGDVLPAAATTLRPGWLNIFGNAALVQFTHRWLGPLTMLVLLGWVARCWKHVAAPACRRGLAALAGMAVLQVLLGIGTLLSHAEIIIAVIHQAGAITLLSLLLWNLHYFSAAPTAGK